jgi:Tol biopolymer transport system component
LAPGERLGPYEIIATLGAGGMGEVYQARDTRLDRIVAVKILAPEIALAPEARQRFEREARTISQLSHPHICALFDVGQHEGTEYLVMEMIDGQTLAERIAKGALPIELTIKYAAQIADALDKAHRRSIVHRELKPANVMITKTGVKLLDFGLARPAPVGAPSAATAAAVSSTGGLAGTLQYMAPEQFDGRVADHRSDIFAFGAVVYEMATGERLFGRPPRSLAPAALDRLVRVAIAVDADDRWQSARDITLQLEAIDATRSSQAERVPAGRGAARLPWAIAAIAIAVAAVLSVFAARRGAVPASSVSAPIRFAIAPPTGNAFWDNLEATPLAVAPDGSRVGFLASDGRTQRVWIRSMSSMDAAPVSGTEGARSLFWSPDGRSIAFFAAGKLKRIDLAAGAPVTVCDVVDGVGLNGTWGSGEMLFAAVSGEAIYRVSAAGGTASVERAPDAGRGERRLQFPSFLPDGRRFIYTVRTTEDGGRVMFAERGQPGHVVVESVTNAQFAKPDVLVYAREGALFAQRFDVRRGEVVGAAISISDRVRHFYSTGVARFAVSLSGTIVFHPQWDVERLAWIDRGGAESGTLATGLYISLRISPDGRRVAYARAQDGVGTFDLWIADTARGMEQRLTSSPGSEVSPVWHPDGATLFFAGGPGAPHAMRKSLSTGEEVELRTQQPNQAPEDITPDGKTLITTARSRSFDTWAIGLDDPGRQSALLATTFNEYQARLSADGRFLAFVSNESGRNEVYVSSFPPRGLHTPVSTGGGTVPRWSRDGRELFFLSADRRLMATPVRMTPRLTVGTPAALFPLRGRRIWKDYDVSPDGKRFLAIVTDVLGDEQPMTAVVNAFASLDR